MLNREVATRRKVEELAGSWRSLVTSSVMLEPPVFLRELVERSDWKIVVLVVVSQKPILTVHPLCKCGNVRMREWKQNEENCSRRDEHLGASAHVVLRM